MIREFKENYRKVKEELKCKAVSQARMIKNALDIPLVAGHLKHENHCAQPIPGAGIRMMDGKPMHFFTDGSIRHAMGYKPGKAARKALKKQRRLTCKKS